MLDFHLGAWVCLSNEPEGRCRYRVPFHSREHFHLYLETDDAAAAADALKKMGVRLVKDVHETAWGTHEFVVKDDQGHTLYFGERRPARA